MNRLREMRELENFSMKILLLLMALLISVASFSQERGSVAMDTGEEIAGSQRALIIGISGYAAESLRLNYADDDAILFRDYLLSESVPEENIVFLTDETATATRIYNELDNLYENSAEGDNIFIYYAGHGDVVTKYDQQTGFLLAYDANEGRNYHGTGGVIELEHLNAVSNALIQKKEAKVNLILDACHSGFLFEDGAKSNLQTFNNNENFKNATKYLSCGPTEVSIESEVLGHGYFTYYLVLGLMGAADELRQDNKLQYFELNDFINYQVKNETGDKQSPVVLMSNPSEEIKVLDSEIKKTALLTLTTKGGLKDALASRGSDSGIMATDELDDPLIKKFNHAIRERNFSGNDNSAYSLYQHALDQEQFEDKILTKMRFSLINASTTQANLLINDYISESGLPGGDVLKENARNLEICLELMNADDYSYNRILVSKLFLEGYAPVRDRNYSFYPHAKEKLSEALELEPRAAYIHNAMGLLQDHEENYDEALYHYQKAAELIPTWSYPVNNIGVLFYDQHQYDKAEEYYTTASELSGELSYNNLGAIREGMGRYSEAEELYRASLERAPSGITFRNLGNLYEDKGNIREAIALFEEAMKIDPTDVFSYYSLGNLLAETGIDPKKAESMFTEAIEMEPFFSRGYAVYADFLRNKSYSPEELQKADSLYTFAIKNDPYYPWSYAGKGWLYHKLKKEGAEDLFIEGIKANKDKAKPYYYYAGFLKSGLKKFPEAEEQYKKALAIDPYYIPTFEGLIDLYNDQKRYQESVRSIKEILQKNSSAPDLWNLLGNTHFSNSEFKQAILAYRKAIEVDSTYAKAYGNLAYSLLQSGSYEEAHQNFLHANSYNPYKNKLDSFSDMLIRSANQEKRAANTQNAHNLLQLAYDTTPTFEAAFALSESSYFIGDLDKSLAIIQKAFNDLNAKPWKIKFLDLAVRASLSKGDLERMLSYSRQLAAINPRPDKLIDALISYSLDDEEESKALIKEVNPLLLKETYLKSRYDKTTMNTIKILLQ